MSESRQSTVQVASAAGIGIGGGVVGMLSAAFGNPLMISFVFTAYCTVLALVRIRRIDGLSLRGDFL